MAAPPIDIARDLPARSGPWATVYPAAVTLALLSLCPYLIVTIAAELLAAQIESGLGISSVTLSLATGLANAAYAFGAVAHAQVTQRMNGRLWMLGWQLVLIVGALLTATAGPVGFFVGLVVAGLGTGALVPAVLPPLITNFGVRKIVYSVVVINLGLFGIVAVGPLLGGLLATTDWRQLFWLLFAFGCAAFGFGLATYQPEPPRNPDLPYDTSTLTLAATGTAFSFAAVATLADGGGFGEPLFIAFLAVGGASLVLLIALEARRERPLIPVERLATTNSVTGIVFAMGAGAIAFAVIPLVALYLGRIKGLDALSVAARFWPLVVGVAAAAGVLYLVFRTRWLPLLALSGMLSTVGAAVLLLFYDQDLPRALIWLTVLLAGYGLGGAIAPGLFMAALSTPAAELARVFAIVELLRAWAAFILAPVLVAIALGGGMLVDGIQAAGLVALCIIGGITVVGLGILAAGGARLRAPENAAGLHRLRPPDFDAWINQGGRAFYSPPLGAALRRNE